MLRSVKEYVDIPLANFSYRFKRLTWKSLLTLHKGDSQKEILISALKSISGKVVTEDEARRIIEALPIPIADRIYIIFIGSLDPRRLFSSSPIYSAPSAVDYETALAREQAEKEIEVDKASSYLEKRFGEEAVREEKDLERRILAETGHRKSARDSKEALRELD